MSFSGSGAVIVGASVAGIAAADALRKNGYTAPVLVVDAETLVPHDKPPLTKQALQPAHDDTRLALRPATHFSEMQINLMLGRRAVAFNAAQRLIRLDDGQLLSADEVVLAPGATPRRLPEDQMLPGVHVIRSLADAVALRTSLDQEPRVVIAGCGFIGAEVASSVRTRGLDVTMVELAARPFEALLGPQPAGALRKLHRQHGVRMLSGVGVAGIEGTGRVQAVRLSDGRRLAADVVVLGLGVTPSVGWLAGSGLTLDDGIVCDRYGRVGLPHVYAAGDAAAWPDPVTGKPHRIEHWTSAQQQGAAVGRNIACPDDLGSAPDVPYFWSDQYGLRIQSLGQLSGPDEIRCVHGDWDSAQFVALYRRGDRLAGALGLNAARYLMPWRAAIEGRAPWEAQGIPVSLEASA